MTSSARAYFLLAANRVNMSGFCRYFSIVVDWWWPLTNEVESKSFVFFVTVTFSRAGRCMDAQKRFGNKWLYSIIDDNRSGVSDVAFRTTPAISRLSCFFFNAKTENCHYRVEHITRAVYLVLLPHVNIIPTAKTSPTLSVWLGTNFPFL